MPSCLLVSGTSQFLSSDHSSTLLYNRVTRKASGRSSIHITKPKNSTPKTFTAAQNRSSSSGGGGGGERWISDNAKAIRRAPLIIGSASLGAILLNRTFSGIAAVADASSSQSRADVLAVALSACVVLTGLVWKSVEPRPQFPVTLEGVECCKLAPRLPDDAARELKWTWEALT